MAIVTTTQPGTFVIPGNYIAETPEPAPPSPGPNTSLLAIDGTANYGDTNTPTFCSPSTLSGSYGNNTSLPFSILDAIENGSAPEAQAYLVNRVSDNTDVASSVLVVDSTGFATKVMTVSGTYTAAQNVSATMVNGSATITTPNYAVQSSDTPTTVAAALVGLINNSPAVLGANAFLSRASNVAGAITYTALNSGTGGNSITVQSTVSGSGFSVTLNSATALAGGATPGTLGTLSGQSTGSYPNASTAPQVISGYRLDISSPSGSTSPVYTLTLFFPGQTSEVFTGIIAYASPGGGYSSTTLQASIAAAVNIGTSAHAPSQFWSWTSGSSTASPLTSTYQGASGGTDGATGVNTSILLGQDGTVGRTGVYAFRGMISAGQVMIAGLRDCTAAQTLAVFAQSENALAGIDLGPSGTEPQAAVTTKNANNVSSRFLVASVEWLNYRDPYTGLQKQCSPTNSIMGVIASEDPWSSPLNKPTGGKGGLISTEWTTGQFPDETLLQQNNICYFKNYNGSLVVFNDNCSDGTPIQDTRMLNYIAYMLQVIGAPFLGQNQTIAMNDQTRGQYFGAIQSFLKGLANANAPKINAFQIVKTGNTQTTIQNAFLLGQTFVTTLRAIRYILNVVQVGSQVVIQQPS
jgi:hypothetical protein